MTVLASTLIARLREQLIDTGSAPRWTDAELLGYLSDGQRTIVAITPSLGSAKTVVQLVSGTRQTTPADGHMLLDVVRNMGMDGLSVGRVIRIVSREVLDNFNPVWHAANQSPTVQNFIYDPSEPQVFHVYPPSNGLNYVELVYSKVPAELAATSDAIALPDLYQTALFYYCMFRAHAKDSDFAAGQSLAQSWLALFQAFMGVAPAADLDESPNQQLAPSDLRTRGAAQ